MLKWYLNFMSINSIPFLWKFHIKKNKYDKYDNCFWKKMKLTMHKATPDIKISVQKYQISVDKEWVCFR